MFKFKTPSEKTLKVMSEVAKGNIEKDYEKSCISKIKDLTGKEHVRMTSSGNNSIFIALSAVEGDIIIPDQGAWHGFKQIARFLKKNIITVKTDLGLIDTDYMEDLDIADSSALIFTSFAGYSAEQDVRSICRYCSSRNITTIEDASAGIGDTKNNLGKNSDIILASTGSPKIINVGSGGFISTDDEEVFKRTSLPQKLDNLEVSLNATDYVKKHIPDAIHADKRGLNVIIPNDNAKSICWDLKKTLSTDKSGFITTCPNYNRVKQKAICVEIKNLDYRCLEKEYLDKIIDEVTCRL